RGLRSFPTRRSSDLLATYPSLLATASDPGSDPWPWFCRVAVMTYGWMPRVVRLDMEHARAAAKALLSAHVVTESDMREIEIAPRSEEHTSELQSREN